MTGRCRCPAAEALDEAKAQAETARRAKSEFLANMSHELRTPLTAVIGFSEIMRDETLGPLGSAKYREYLQHIHQSGRRLLEVVDQIVAVFNVDTGRLALDESVFPVGAMVESCMVRVHACAEKNGLRLINGTDCAAIRLRADERRLSQVVLGLLSNSIKFTPEGGTIHVTATVAPDNWPEIAVADTGIGMAPEDIPRAFAPAALTASTRSRRHPGMGLGLYLSRSLVEMHGGRLMLDSRPGAGTTVTVRLPPDRLA